MNSRGSSGRVGSCCSRGRLGAWVKDTQWYPIHRTCTISSGTVKKLDSFFLGTGWFLGALRPNSAQPRDPRRGDRGRVARGSDRGGDRDARRTARAASPPAPAGFPRSWSARSSASACWSAMLMRRLRARLPRDQRPGRDRTSGRLAAHLLRALLQQRRLLPRRLRHQRRATADQVATAADAGGDRWRDRLRCGFNALLAFADRRAARRRAR